MQLKEFMAAVGTTRDTVRFYIEKDLLAPNKSAGKYVFTRQEITAYDEIIQLKELGFSIELIRKIKRQHDINCSTSEQWQQNLALVENEIQGAEYELKRIEQRKEKLTRISNQLKDLLMTK
ncbi:MAG: MerR family transcriptional regulator [Oenococcus sp.]|uniref:MerR family transcriptional regulator n=1 Tax=Oenococcus TaxID=46254 RepID=UPI0021E8F8DC|nr:MerR family transcriptional regulator [Oenococcus kitaharae]MCV3295833.1 MerR family transcriptional regulator [Oenococcus kitaharae]